MRRSLSTEIGSGGSGGSPGNSAVLSLEAMVSFWECGGGSKDEDSQVHDQHKKELLLSLAGGGGLFVTSHEVQPYLRY